MLNQWAIKQTLAEEKKRVYWWQSKKDDRPNIGDYVAYDLVKRVLAMKGKLIKDKLNPDNKLVSVGSVLHFARDGDTLWGTGYNQKMGDDVIKFSELDVRAVRGPLTREYLKCMAIRPCCCLISIPVRSWKKPTSKTTSSLTT